MFSDPAFLAAAFFAVLLVGLAKGGFSGIGMAATPLLALTMPPLQALAILLPILMMQDVISVWWYRHDWDPWNVKVMLPGAVVGTGLAWALAAVVPDDAVRLLIGAIGVLFVLNVWFGKMPPPRRPSAASGVFWGAASAFTSTIASAGMPPFAVHVLPQRMDKMRLVGTVTMFFAAVNLLRVAPYYGLGQLTRETLFISLMLMPLAIATNFLGFWLVQRIPTGPFYRITYALMFLISAALLAQGAFGLLRGFAILGA
ncbi:MAG: sulfite exporter TauE/SafE family protein [Alphaproteobacteria bacterium]|nr:MAG: sulfite exporter TauE/SafE family protein [Alphaproteobacteria bacterium]